MPPSHQYAEQLPRIEQCAFRAFDRQYIFADDRLVDRLRAPLWSIRSRHQVFASVQHDQQIKSGPGVIFTQLVPDQHHFAARGGKAFPLYKHAQAQEWAANIPLSLRQYLASRFAMSTDITPERVLAYIAAVAGHPDYTRRFWNSLRRPGIRIPITADRSLWSAACNIGSEVIWLHTFGTRYFDATRGLPEGPPRLPRDRRPEIVERISDELRSVPEDIRYDADSQQLHIGNGIIGRVAPEAWEYQVCGKQIIRQWFSFRQRSRQYQRRSSLLDDTRLDRWTIHLTKDLLDLIHVLTMLVDLEPSQKALLEQICGCLLITVDDLKEAGVLPGPPTARKAPHPPLQDELRYNEEPP
jgi:predicted helicase